MIMAEKKHVQKQFLRNAEIIKGYIYAFLPDLNEAEDIFQEVFMVAVRKSSTYRKDTNFLAWIRAIAGNKVLQHIEQRKRDRKLCLSAAAVKNMISTGDGFEKNWDSHRYALEKCMKKITGKSRRLLQLRYVEDIPPRRISQRLNRTVNGVSSALSKVRDFLRNCINQVLSSGRDAV
jgi:RNA polymerase sigma-70 factor (ECF subfamily)